MIFLVLSIFCSVIIVMLFKVFERFPLDVFGLIVLNYAVCVLSGTMFNDFYWFIRFTENITSWGWVAVLLGFCFINIFRLVGQVAQNMGVSVATVSMKLGFVVPVSIAVLFYNEPLNGLKVAGILAALPAVILSSMKEEHHEEKLNWKIMLLPLIIFLGSGICDSITQYIRHQIHSNEEQIAFVITAFCSAFFFGFIGWLIQFIKKKKPIFGAYGLLSVRSLLFALLLGIPNYGSFYFVVLAMQKSGLSDTQLFPVNNIGIVSVATLSSFLIFRENLGLKNWLGVGFAILSIVLIALS